MLPTLPNLDGLIGLARQDGVDVRPTLVRVLTDLYVQKRVHTREEEHRYTELTLSLLTGVDATTRAAVARKLSTYGQAPHLVVRRLARDVFEVAEPVLRCSPSLTSEDLLAIIKDFGPRYAAAIGERNSANAPAADDPAGNEVAAGPVSIAPGGTNEVATGRPSVIESRSGGPVDPAADLRPAASQNGRLTLGDYFMNAGSPERRLLLTNLDDGTLSPSEQALAASTEDAIGKLEAAALQRQPDEFVRGLQQSLRISAHRARQIVHDDSGEPIVVAAKALAMPADVLLRILLFLNPVIGHSVERVFDLVHLYERLTQQAALHLVSSWQHAVPGAKPDSAYQPLHWDDERRGARRTFADPVRRFPLQVPDDRGYPARREAQVPPGRSQRTS